MVILDDVEWPSVRFPGRFGEGMTRGDFDVISGADHEQLVQVVSLLGNVLHTDIIAAYLYGSAASGALRPTSDLDVLAVSRRTTTRYEKQRLVEPLLEISGGNPRSGRKRSVDLTIVVAGEVKPWRYPPRFDFQYGDWWREKFETGEIEPWETNINPDLTIVLTNVMHGGKTLLGPPPQDLFDPVPKADLNRAMLDEIDGLLGDLSWDTRNVLLTLSRIWRTVATGEICSKDDAASWAIQRLPEIHRPVMSHARADYRGEATDRWDELSKQAEACATYVVGAARGMSGSKGVAP